MKSFILNDTPKLVHRSTKLSRLIVPFADYYLDYGITPSDMVIISFR